jgi:hypothetical protein
MTNSDSLKLDTKLSVHSGSSRELVQKIDVKKDANDLSQPKAQLSDGSKLDGNAKSDDAVEVSIKSTKLQ